MKRLFPILILGVIYLVACTNAGSHTHNGQSHTHEPSDHSQNQEGDSHETNRDSSHGNDEDQRLREDHDQKNSQEEFVVDPDTLAATTDSLKKEQ